MKGGRLLLRAALVLFLLAGPIAATAVSAAPAERPLAQQGPPGDWGDAPEGVTVNAYPFLGFVPGRFPTCMNVPITTWVYHAPPPVAWFGPVVDFEVEGNASICPSFTPYDFDECFADGDAGLIVPEPYTILGGAELPCPGVAGSRLGLTCTPAVWGPDVDILVTNSSQEQVFVNVVMDWDQAGTWGGASPCPGAPAPEWVLVNFPVPPGFVGPLSALVPPPFLIGPNRGFVWARFTISETPIVATDWDGSGLFQIGESEDYLLRIDPPPLAVTLDDFAASAESDQILVTWRTTSEIDNAGFNLWRSETADGPQSLVAYQPSQSPGGTAGAEYQFADVDVQVGQTYWYWLEAVDFGGQTTRHGPVSATVEAPSSVTLTGMNTEFHGSAVVPSLWAIVAVGLAALATAAALRRRPAAHSDIAIRPQ